MKTKLRLPALVLLASGFFLSTAGLIFAGDTTEDLDIDVRSSSDVFWIKSKNDARAAAEKTRHQTYGLFFVTVVPAPDQLVRPVDAVAIATELEHQLSLQGFTKAKPGTKPDILISGEYGRGWLPNPYETGRHVDGNQGAGTTGMGAALGMVPNYATSLPQESMRLLDGNWQRKRLKNSLEKLYIRVRAWQYPKNPKDRLKSIWTTEMIVDDPDHRDLNVVAKPMLAAGADYFARALDDPEKPDVTLTKPVPIGQVDVGPTTVVGKDE